MKISTLVVMLLMVGIIMFTVFQMINETESNYNVRIDASNWTEEGKEAGKYDFASDVNEQIQPIKNSIDTIQNEDSGWLDIIGSGFTGIIAAVTFIPAMSWSLISLTTALITGLGEVIGIPSYITFVFIVMLSAWGIFVLIQFLHRWREI